MRILELILVIWCCGSLGVASMESNVGSSSTSSFASSGTSSYEERKMLEEDVVAKADGCHDEDLCAETCATTLTIPDLMSCRQCRHLGCGSIIKYGGHSSCSCDALCMFYADCCKDFEVTCPQVYDEAWKVKEMSANISKPGCQIIDGVGQQEINLVNTCSGQVCEIDDSGLKADHYPLPVTDLELGVHYSNVQCAKCNGARNFTTWSNEIQCNLNYNPENITRSDMFQWISLGICRINISYSDKVRFCVESLYESCTMETCNNPDVVDKCRDEQTFYVNYGHINYRNIYCMLCDHAVSPCAS